MTWRKAIGKELAETRRAMSKLRVKSWRKEVNHEVKSEANEGSRVVTYLPEILGNHSGRSKAVFIRGDWCQINRAGVRADLTRGRAQSVRDKCSMPLKFGKSEKSSKSWNVALVSTSSPLCLVLWNCRFHGSTRKRRGGGWDLSSSPSRVSWKSGENNFIFNVDENESLKFEQHVRSCLPRDLFWKN